jgi:hypothetical protein
MEISNGMSNVNENFQTISKLEHFSILTCVMNKKASD